MTRMPPFSSPLLLGFDAMEKTIERLAKSGDSYPPYNIERIGFAEGSPERLRITLAVAGFCDDDLEVTTEERLHSPRHRGAPVPAHLCSRGRNAGADGGAQERASVDRSGPAATGTPCTENKHFGERLIPAIRWNRKLSGGLVI
jgi:hypothetical protein